MTFNSPISFRSVDLRHLSPPKYCFKMNLVSSTSMTKNSNDEKDTNVWKMNLQVYQSGASQTFRRLIEDNKYSDPQLSTSASGTFFAINANVPKLAPYTESMLHVHFQRRSELCGQNKSDTQGLWIKYT